MHVTALAQQMQSKLLPKNSAFLEWVSQCPAASIREMSFMDKQWVAGFLANFSAEIYTSEYFSPSDK